MEKKEKVDRSRFKLLTRTAFREGTFARDNYACVWCGTKEGPHDAHHIFERKLWPDEGYYLSNSVTLCEPCHRLAESTEMSTEDLHKRIGAVKYPIPPSFVVGESYDKWGNPILANGTRTKGPLFQVVPPPIEAPPEEPRESEVLGSGDNGSTIMGILGTLALAAALSGPRPERVRVPGKSATGPEEHLDNEESSGYYLNRGVP